MSSRVAITVRGAREHPVTDKIDETIEPDAVFNTVALAKHEAVIKSIVM